MNVPNETAGDTCEHGKIRLVATCPTCQKKIFLHQLLQAISTTERGDNALTCVTLLHGQKPDRHALTLFVDRNNRVRGHQVSNAIIVSRK